MKNYASFLFLGLLACSVLKKEDPNKSVLSFLAQFDQSIHQSDSVVLSHFNTFQSKESILAAIRLLRSPDKDYITCQPNYGQAEIYWNESNPRVTIPVTITSIGNESHVQSIFLWLEPNGDSFSITRLAAEVFYQNYFQAFSEIRFQKELREQEEKLQVHFEYARELQKSYDSVIWFATWNDTSYYYVIKGEWNENSIKNPDQYEMGLVNETGRVIVPPAFDLVGSIGITFPDIIEITLQGKVGYYSLSGTELVPPIYDVVIPYITPETKAIVKADTTIGWLDKNFVYHSGYPWPEVQQYVKDLRFLDTPIRFGKDTQVICNALDMEKISDGTIIPPNYLVKYGMFSPIMSGFVTGFHGSPGYVEYIQKQSFNTFDLAETVKIVIANFKSRFLDGREEFYHSNDLVLIDQNLDTLSTAHLWGESIELKRIDSVLLEVKQMYESWEPDELGTLNFPYYDYFQIQNNKLIPLESKRVHRMTEFVKLDSSYFTGNFKLYDFETDQEIEVTFLPTSFFEGLREEILASYGYRFKDPKTIKKFEYHNWYSPRFNTYQEVFEIASEIDKHNLKFIETITGSVNLESI